MAIVGASANRARAVYGVWRYLKSASDYELYLVNPTIGDVDGTPTYPDLASLPVVPDLVDVFRRHEHLPAVLDDAIGVGGEDAVAAVGSGQTSRWRATAKPRALQVVMDRCLKVEYARLLSAS